MSIYVSGTGLTKVAEHWSDSLIDLAVKSAKQAISESNTSPDVVIIGNMLSSTSNQENLGGLISEKLGLNDISTFKIESSSCSGAMAINVAYNLLQSNNVNSILVVGVEKMTDLSPSQIIRANTFGESSEYIQYFGITMNSLYALFSKLYMDKYKISKEELSHFPVLSHKNSVSCEHAQFRKEFSIESISKASIVSSPLGLLDCSPIGDGSASVILSKDNKSNFDNIEILASSSSNSPVNFFEREDLLKFSSTKNSFTKALSNSKKQLSDIDILEIHDVVPAITARILETFGFSKNGEAVQDLISGKYALNSKPSISTFGGLKARGNPLSATGIYQIIETTWRLQNRSELNINNSKIGLCHNMSGIDSNSVVTILEAVN